MKPTKNLSCFCHLHRLLTHTRLLLLIDRQRPLIAYMHRRIYLPSQHSLARMVEHLQRPDPATFRIIAYLDSGHDVASAFHDGFAGNEISVRLHYTLLYTIKCVVVIARDVSCYKNSYLTKKTSNYQRCL